MGFVRAEAVVGDPRQVNRLGYPDPIPALP